MRAWFALAAAAAAAGLLAGRAAARARVPREEVGPWLARAAATAFVRLTDRLGGPPEALR